MQINFLLNNLNFLLSAGSEGWLWNRGLQAYWFQPSIWFRSSTGVNPPLHKTQLLYTFFPLIFWGPVFIVRSWNFSLTFAKTQIFSMSAPNILLLSSAFSPRHRPLEIRDTFSPRCPFCPINIAAINTKQDLEILSIGQTWNKKRVFNWKRSHAFLVIAKRAPLSLVVFPCVSTAITRWIWLTVSLGQWQDISHCNSKPSEKGVVTHAKRGYRVAEILHFQG